MYWFARLGCFVFGGIGTAFLNLVSHKYRTIFFIFVMKDLEIV